jgi:lipoate-protein ligase B
MSDGIGERELHARWIGRQGYDDAHRRQIEIRDRVVKGDAGPTLLLLEHDPVITLGRRGECGDLVAPLEILEQRGIGIRSAERGGRATFHGPGQLVGYLIAPVRRLAPDVPTYVWRLEEALIRTVAGFGIRAGRDDRNRGVWVGDAKLASIGIAVHRGVCWHGFALNLDPDLSAFALIRPCGLDIAPTSMARLVFPAPAIVDVAHVVAREIAHLVDLTLVAG